MDFPERYPFESPKNKIYYKIFHPNINSKGDVDILKKFGVRINNI